MESIFQVTPNYHFLTEIYPQNIKSFFSQQKKHNRIHSMTNIEKLQKQQQERIEKPTIIADIKINNRPSWTASSNVLPMETILEEEE
ncbi:unnamed protein product [Cunninghamella echinulata]